MKKFSLLIAFIFVLTSLNCCQSQEWDSIMDNYSKNQIERPVTPQEFEKALETVQSYQKKPKVKKKKKKKGEVQDMPMQQPPVQMPKKEPPPSELLLRLPLTTRWNNNVLPDGFYLIEKVIRDRNYYLQVKQSGTIYAELSTVTADGKYTGFPEVSVHNTGKNSIEIIYTDKESSIKSELPIYIPPPRDDED